MILIAVQSQQRNGPNWKMFAHIIISSKNTKTSFRFEVQYNILAFIILMIVEYIESIITVKYEEIFKVLIKSTQDTIEHLEDENNG